MTRTDLTVFLSGAAFALTAGVLLGGTMRPSLNIEDGRPAGPQMFAAWDGHSTGPFDPGAPEATLAAYHGKTPDYVMGTDWKKALAPPRDTAATSPPADPPAEPAAAPAPALTPVVYEAPPPPTRDYPSMGGAHPWVIQVPASAADGAEAPDAGG